MVGSLCSGDDWVSEGFIPNRESKEADDFFLRMFQEVLRRSVTRADAFDSLLGISSGSQKTGKTRNWRADIP